MGPELSRGQASDWHTDRQTDRHTHTHTDAGNDNTRRPKLASGKNWKIDWRKICNSRIIERYLGNHSQSFPVKYITKVLSTTFRWKGKTYSYTFVILCILWMTLYVIFRRDQNFLQCIVCIAKSEAIMCISWAVGYLRYIMLCYCSGAVFQTHKLWGRINWSTCKALFLWISHSWA